MGQRDRTNWKRWGVKGVLSFGYTLRERSKIGSRGSNAKMEVSSSSYDFISLANNGMLFDSKEVNIPWRFN
jgi:hypothetical protein